MSHLLRVLASLCAVATFAVPTTAFGAWGTTTDLPVVGHVSGNGDPLEPEGAAGLDDAGAADVLWVTRPPGNDPAGRYLGTDLYAARRPAGGAWPADGALLHRVAANIRNVRLAVAGSGDAAAAWFEWNFDTGATAVRVAYRPAGGSWTVSTDPVASNVLAAHYGGYHEDLDVAIDPDGRATVAWRGQYGGGVYETHRTPAGSWSAPQAILDGTTAPGMGLSVAADGGVALAAAVIDAEGLRVRTRRFDPIAAAWGPVETVPGSHVPPPPGFVAVEDAAVQQPAVAASADGSLAVVWRSGTPSDNVVLGSRRAANGTWSATPQRLSSVAATGGTAFENAWPTIAADDQGRFVAAWLQNETWTLPAQPQGVAVTDYDTGWAAAQTLMPATSDRAGRMRPVARMSGPGDAIVVAGSPPGHPTAATRDAGGAWSLHAFDEDQPDMHRDQPEGAISSDGAAIMTWYAGDGLSTPTGRRLSEFDPSTGGGDAGGGDAGGGSGDGGSGGGRETASTPGTLDGGTVTPSPLAARHGSAGVDTTRPGVMPKVVGRRLDSAVGLIEKAAILWSDIDVTYVRRAKRGTDIGDVTAQSPAPGTRVKTSTGEPTRIRLSVYRGPAPVGDDRCDARTLSRDLRGAELPMVEDLLKAAKCKVRYTVSIGAKDDEATLAGLKPISRNSNTVTANVGCPKSTSDHDLFAFVREGPYSASTLSFGAEDWALTAHPEQRNSVSLTVFQRGGYVDNSGRVAGKLVKNVKVIVDGAAVGDPTARAVPTDGAGISRFSLRARRAGTVDICLVGEGANGKAVYGAVQLRVVKRTGSYGTVSGRLMTKTREGWIDKAASTGAPTLIREARARAAFDPFAALSGLVQSLVRSFSGPVPSVFGSSASAQEKLATASRKLNFGVGQMAFGKPIGPTSTAIAAGGGNVVTVAGDRVGIISDKGLGVIAAGGGNVIAAGGGNLLGQAGSNAICAGGYNFIGGAIDVTKSNVIAAGGGNLIGQAGSNLVGQAGTNLVGQAGTNLVGQAGTNLIGQAGSNLIGQAGSNVVVVGRMS